MLSTATLVSTATRYPAVDAIDSDDHEATVPSLFAKSRSPAGRFTYLQNPRSSRRATAR